MHIVHEQISGVSVVLKFHGQWALGKKKFMKIPCVLAGSNLLKSLRNTAMIFASLLLRYHFHYVCTCPETFISPYGQLDKARISCSVVWGLHILPPVIFPVLALTSVSMEVILSS